VKGGKTVHHQSTAINRFEESCRGMNERYDIAAGHGELMLVGQQWLD
jgi:hypothetical protein